MCLSRVRRSPRSAGAPTPPRTPTRHTCSDGFGGGDHLSNNLLVNTCRESGDHGPWNSWNRVPYITTERTGKPSIIPKDVHIEKNFFLGNYNAIAAVDTDDGSAYLKVHDNVLGYATAGLKSDFGGHQEVYFNNLLAYVHDCIMDGMDSDRFPGHPNSIDTIVALTDDLILTGSSDGLIRLVNIQPHKRT